MGITSRLKTRYQHLIGKRFNKTIKRNQFNLTMAEDIIIRVKLIAAVLEVPYYIACEHILQVGSQNVLRDIDNPEKREELKEHLIKVHLLGNELKEDKDILMLGPN